MFCPECGEVMVPGPLDGRHPSAEAGRRGLLESALRRLVSTLKGRRQGLGARG